MIPGIAITLCGMCIGLGLWWMLSTVLTPMARLEPAIERLSPGHLDLTPAQERPETDRPDLVERVGAWTERALGSRVGGLTPQRDLALLGGRRTRWWGLKTIGALAGLLVPNVSSALMTLAGGSLNLAIPFGAGLALAAVAWFVPDLKVRGEAKAARYDFSLAVAAYLQQVAILRRASYGPTDAMTKAAHLSQSWTFRRIQAALFRADLAHVPPWTALEQLSTDLDVPELEAAADIMRSAGESGAGVWPALMARSNAIRQEAMANAQGKSKSSTTAMSAPIALMAMVFFAGVVFPALMQLSAA